MLKNSFFALMLLVAGCQHDKKDFSYNEPPGLSESVITPAIIEQPKPQTANVGTEAEEKAYHDASVGSEGQTHEEVEIQANAPMETKAVEARPETRDAEIQTEEELMESLDLESINLGEDLEDERQEVAPRLQRNLSDMTIYESEYLEESEDEI